MANVGCRRQAPPLPYQGPQFALAGPLLLCTIGNPLPPGLIFSVATPPSRVVALIWNRFHHRGPLARPLRHNAATTALHYHPLPSANVH
jgi:hypothetical protein